MSVAATCEACRGALDAVRSFILDERELCRRCFDEEVSKLPFRLRFAASVKASDDLDDDDPLWCVNEQIKGLLQGEGATEDHEHVLEFLSKTGLPDGTVKRMHQAMVFGESKVLTPYPETMSGEFAVDSSPEDGVSSVSAGDCAIWHINCFRSGMMKLWGPAFCGPLYEKDGKWHFDHLPVPSWAALSAFIGVSHSGASSSSDSSSSWERLTEFERREDEHRRQRWIRCVGTIFPAVREAMTRALAVMDDLNDGGNAVDASLAAVWGLKDELQRLQDNEGQARASDLEKR